MPHEDDIHIRNSGGKSGATHAHNVVLEVMADTGSIGLLGLFAGFVLVLRFWRSMTSSPAQRGISFCAGAGLGPFPAQFAFRTLRNLHDITDLDPVRTVGGLY